MHLGAKVAEIERYFRPIGWGGRCDWMVEYIDYIVNGISTIHISKSPARSEWKAIYFPSADHVG